MPHVLRGAFFLLKLEAMSNIITTHFDQALFRKYLKTKYIGQSFIFLEETASTNSYIKSLSERETPHGLICLADNQTAGRGQHNRIWLSEPGKNLTFSLVLKPPQSNKLQLLLQAMGLAVKLSVLHNCDCKCTIKWPNDVLYEEKKIAGILTESTFLGNELERFIMGVGINVNNKEIPLNIKENADSLINITQKVQSRELLLAEICNSIASLYELWLVDSEELVHKINNAYAEIGKWVHLSEEGKQIPVKYKFLGLDFDGYPLFLTDDSFIKKYRQQNIRFWL